MQLPSIKRFLAEDFKDQSSWIGKLFNPLNQLLTTIYAGFNNGLTFSENMLSQVRTVTLNGASPSTSFKWNFQTKPIGLVVINAQDSSGLANNLTSVPGVDWTYSAGEIIVKNVYGLNPAQTYLITFIAIGG